MSNNDIILTARALDEKCNYEGVIALLEEYVKEHDDKTAMAFYQKNLVLKGLENLGVSSELLYKSKKERYQNIPEDKVLQLAELIFMYEIADAYLSGDSFEKNNERVYAFLTIGVEALGERVENYNVLKEQLDKFYEIAFAYGFGENFYEYLVLMVDWRSKVSENILRYLVEKTETLATTDKAIYDSYISDKTGVILPYKEKPELNGERLVIVNIKTEEEKDFWKGYFALVKKIRQDEYETYQKAMADKNHKLHGAYLIGQQVYDSYINAIMKKIVSTEEIAQMQVATGCGMIERSESGYKSRVENAEKSYNTVKVNPIEQIKTFINQFLQKMKK